MWPYPLVLPPDDADSLSTRLTRLLHNLRNPTSPILDWEEAIVPPEEARPGYLEDRRWEVAPGLGGEWEYPAMRMDADGRPNHGAQYFDELSDLPPRSPLYMMRRNSDGTIDYTPAGPVDGAQGRNPDEILRDNTWLRYLFSGVPPIVIKKQGRRQD